MSGGHPRPACVGVHMRKGGPPARSTVGPCSPPEVPPKAMLLKPSLATTEAQARWAWGGGGWCVGGPCGLVLRAPGGGGEAWEPDAEPLPGGGPGQGMAASGSQGQ